VSREEYRYDRLLKLLNEGALPVWKAVDYAAQIARGLSAAHEKAAVHRDPKPESLLINDDGPVKIFDFGLAKSKPQKLAGKVDTEAPTNVQQTAPGTVMGTVAYEATVRGLRY
jgi:serine/threonine protein kinase